MVHHALCLAFILLLSLPAHALTQPDSTVIPQGTALQQLFTDRGEMISALNDAAITPETFTPTCKLEFEVLLRLASYQNSFGWYNVTGTKPALSEHYEFLSCSDAVGTTKTLDIKNDPNYLGGDIAFYQAVGPCGSVQNHLHIVYSEKSYNPDNTQQAPYIHLLIYNSTVTPSAFYFSWEDLLQGGDNDFTDLTTLVTGITCTGGGAACETGQLGICADGTMQCQAGALVCVPNNVAVTEACNGLDDDCDGDTDEGDDICPDDQVCDQGSCVPKCGSDEFVCLPDEICSPEGLCIDPDCLDVDCPPGTKCDDDGFCVGPCDGVVCPYNRVCRVGVCVDPCLSIACDIEQLCVQGVCTDHCDCIGCAMSDTCLQSGECIPTPCVGVTCAAGEYCAPDGTCTDACLGAVCPQGEICEVGECIPDPNPPGQGGAGGMLDFGDGGGTSSTGAGGAGAAGGAPGQNAASNVVSPLDGCACAVLGSSRDDEAAWWLLLSVGVAFRRVRSRVANRNEAGHDKWG